MAKRVGILTAGGDSPGLNAAIRGFGKAAIGHHGMELIGVRDGIRGLVENRYLKLDNRALSGILTIGGTVLGVLPLVALAQIGTIICVGVLLDTLVVRTVLVPALALLLGDAFWWPRHVGHARHTMEGDGTAGLVGGSDGSTAASKGSRLA